MNENLFLEKINREISLLLIERKHLITSLFVAINANSNNTEVFISNDIKHLNKIEIEIQKLKSLTNNEMPF